MLYLIRIIPLFFFLIIQMVAGDSASATPSLSSSDFKVFGEEVVTVRTEIPSLMHHRRRLPHEDEEVRRVTFQAFNETYNVTLRPSKGLLSPSFGVISRSGDDEGNVTLNKQQHHHLSGCFYRGVDAAFDLCKGLRGIVSLSANEFLSVTPFHRRRKQRSLNGEEHHLIRRISWKAKPSIRPIAEEFERGRRRRRRDAPKRQQGITIETAVFVDAYLYSHMTRTHFLGDDAEKEMTHFVLAMINAVQMLYQDESLGREISFQVQRLEMWSRQPQELQPALTGSSSTKQGIHDIDRYLNRFCQWQSRENPTGDQDSDHWDHALLLTGLDLFAVGRDGVSSHQIVGLAPIGGMCTSSSSCTVNEGRHFEAVYVVAHEIGHNLGMKHDGREAGNDCDAGSYLMSPTLGSGKTQWSPCSQHYLNSFLNTMQAGCLTDRSWIPERMDHNASTTLPGERFSADQQCMLRYGRDSRRASQRSLNEICRDLRCTDNHRSVRQTSGSGMSFTSHPALEGTSCGEGMWCRRGRCSSRVQFQHYVETDPPIQAPGSLPFEKHVTTVDPTWSTVTPCASGCLYGADYTLKSGSMAVTLQMKNCEANSRCGMNVPMRYQTCDGSQLCNRVNRTTIQQYSDDICSQAAQQNESILPRGLQQVSVDAFRSCQVWCYLKSGGLMTSAGWNFPDGTKCHINALSRLYSTRFDDTGPSATSQHLCLSGRCQEFTCDGRSGHKLHDEACRSESPLPIESNIIYDSPYASQVVNPTFKYVDHLHPHRQPIRASEQHHQKHYYSPPSVQQQQPFQSRLAIRSEPLRYSSSNSSSSPSPNSSGWGPWKSVSSCRSGCLTSSQGLRLVQRSCDSGSCGPGPVRSVQLCIPNQQECPALQPISSFADQVCREQHWSDLNRGVWISGEKTENVCIIQCQNTLTNEIVEAQGENGWFPSGTRCNHRTAAYCLSGRCVEFNDEGIPEQ